MTPPEKVRVREYAQDWFKIDPKRWNELKSQYKESIREKDQQLKKLDATIAQAKAERKELFQNYGKDMAAKLTKTPKSEPVVTKSTISSISNKFKRS